MGLCRSAAFGRRMPLCSSRPTTIPNTAAVSTSRRRSSRRFSIPGTSSRWSTERRTGERFSYAVRSVVTREILGGVELLPLLRVLVDPDNTASKRVALRNGFVEGGVFEGRARYILQSTQ